MYFFFLIAHTTFPIRNDTHIARLVKCEMSDLFAISCTFFATIKLSKRS